MNRGSPLKAVAWATSWPACRMGLINRKQYDQGTVVPMKLGTMDSGLRVRSSRPLTVVDEGDENEEGLRHNGGERVSTTETSL